MWPNVRSERSGRLRPAIALFLGASSMFANMYATQAILPEIGDGLHISPAVAGLSITVVVAAVAVGGWLHGPLSDRIGRARVMVASAALLIVPTALLAVVPNAASLLVLRAVQGVLMPGLLVVAVPYVAERFRGPTAGAAMGAYTSSLVFGGFVGRVGTALLGDAWGWRAALGALAVPTALGAVTMWRWLPRDRPHQTSRPLGGAIADHLRNRRLLLNAFSAAATFFGFVGVFTYGTYRLTSEPFHLSLAGAGLVYAVWLVGALVPLAGAVAHSVGPSRVLPWLAASVLAGGLLTLVDSLAVVVAGMALMALGMFSTVTVCQLLIPRLVDHHRGTATSLHLTVYYLGGALGAYLPGLWLGNGWGAVVNACSLTIGAGLISAFALRATLRT
jgi:MFS transporter, YNFM family, putative membrane transport protein